MTWAILASTIALYLAAFLWLGPNAGAMLTALYALPCLVAGWGFGLSGGITVALLMAPLDAWLVSSGYLSSDGLVGGHALGVLSASATGASVGLARDLRERLRATRAALHESESRYQHLAEGVNDAVLVHDHRRIVSANGALARLLGAPTPGALVGRPLEALATVAERDELRARFAAAAPGAPLELDATLARADGGEVPVRLAVWPIRYHGAPARMVLVHARAVARGEVRVAVGASR